MAISVRNLSKNINLIFLIAFLSGLFFGNYAHSFKGYILPALVFIMSLSTTQITLAELIHFRRYLRDILNIFVINYLLLSGIILLANQWFIKDQDLYVGFVIMAAIPSAIAILPFTYLLKGEMMVSLIGSASLYLLALVMAPLLSFHFLEIGRIEPHRVILSLIQLILVPFVVSRILIKWKAFPSLKEYISPLVTLTFGFIIFIVIGINRSTFLRDFDILLLVSGISFLRTFGTGHLVYLISRAAGVDRKRRMCYVLFGSFKNLGLAAAISIVLFNERAAIPSAIAIPFEILFFIWFNYYQKRWDPESS